MLKSVDIIKTQITPKLQKLIDDIRLESDDHRPLVFGDEEEFKTIMRKAFPAEANACFIPSADRFFIFLKRIDNIKASEEYAIAHELGHLWLLLRGLPPEKMTTDNVKQIAWDSFFSPLREIMEHAVYYPLLKSKYDIDLYQIGNERLVDFIKNQLPSLKKTTAEEITLLILNYIKYAVESDSIYWLERLQNAYSRNKTGAKNIAENMLPIIKQISGTIDPQLFVRQYCQAVEIIDKQFGIPANLWPVFCKPN